MNSVTVEPDPTPSFQVTIGIPTIDSESYICNSLTRYIKEIEMFPDRIRANMVICVNGSKPRCLVSELISEFAEKQSHIDICLLETEERGKNNALNMIVKQSKKSKSDVIHFLDDDVILKEGSLRKNIEVLIETSTSENDRRLVGSNFIALETSFNDFLKQKRGVIAAANSWILHQIFRVPFRPSSERPNFCIGQSLCAFLDDFPEYPSDDTGIADDAFLCSYYALKGKELYLDKSISPILKPTESLVYFNTPQTFSEWLPQQVRIYIGVLRAHLMHEDQLDYFKEYFAWKYNVDKDWRGTASSIVKRDFDWIIILRVLQKIILLKSRKILKSELPPPWSVAHSTKKMSDGLIEEQETK